MKRINLIIISLILAVLINSTIFAQTNTTYFVPSLDVQYISPANEDGNNDVIDLRLIVKQIPKMQIADVSFKVYNAAKKIVYMVQETYESLAPKIQDYIYYKGMSTDGTMLADGKYTYTLEFNDTTKTKYVSPQYAFEVDNTAPTIEVMDIYIDEDIATVRVKGSKEVKWQLIASDTNDNRTVIFEQITENAEALKSPLTWNITDIPSTLIASITNVPYTFYVMAQDKAGNSTLLQANNGAILSEKSQVLLFDAKMKNMDANLLIFNASLPAIYYPAYSKDIFSEGETEMLYENLRRVAEIVQILTLNPSYNLEIIGHAAAISISATGKLDPKEQEKDLMPLSRDRANQIKTGLMRLGIPESRLSVKAVGGSQPKLLITDETNLWKNRRVEFSIVQ